MLGVALGASDHVSADDSGGIYFESINAQGGRLVSATTAGVRWTSAQTWLPALVGSQNIALSGFVDLSLLDGSVVHLGMPTSPTVGYGALSALVTGGQRLLSVTFAPSGSFGVEGTLVADDLANSIWSEPGMIASTAIPDVGRVYGIERSSSGNGRLVAIAAPIAGLEASAWPMVKHDPGRTSSAAGSW